MSERFMTSTNKSDYIRAINYSLNKAETISETVDVLVETSINNVRFNYTKPISRYLNADYINENFDIRLSLEELNQVKESLSSIKFKNMNDKFKLKDTIESVINDLDELISEDELYRDNLMESVNEFNNACELAYGLLQERSMIKKLEDKLDKSVDNFIKKKIKAKRNEDVNNVIKGALPKASKIIKWILGLSIGTLVGMASPVGAVVAISGAITKLALDKKSKKEAKRRVLKQLKNELEMVEEKIKDANAEGNKEAKYELMRAKQKIEENIEKVKYNIKRVEVDDVDE